MESVVFEIFLLKLLMWNCKCKRNGLSRFLYQKITPFIRNVLEEDKLKKSTLLKSLSDYYNVFLEFTKVFLLLEDSIKRMIYFDEITEKDLKDFCEKDCAEFNNFPERLEQIKKFKVKNISKKISRLTIQLMGFVYTRMMNFSNSDF